MPPCLSKSAARLSALRELERVGGLLRDGLILWIGRADLEHRAASKHVLALVWEETRVAKDTDTEDITHTEREVSENYKALRAMADIWPDRCPTQTEVRYGFVLLDRSFQGNLAKAGVQ